MFDNINLLKFNFYTAWLSCAVLFSLTGCVHPDSPVEGQTKVTEKSAPSKADQTKTKADRPKETVNQQSVIIEKMTLTKTEQGKIIVGELEWAKVVDAALVGTARIDTGATISSIHAKDIVTFERNGEDWVRFSLVYADQVSRPLTYPVQRWLKVRQSSSKTTVVNRPVIELWIQLGDLKTKTLFNLADRSQMKYDILLGRSLFRDMAVVDVSRQYVQQKPI